MGSNFITSYNIKIVARSYLIIIINPSPCSNCRQHYQHDLIYCVCSGGKKNTISHLACFKSQKSYVQFSIWGYTGLSGQMTVGSTEWGESLAAFLPPWWSPGLVCGHLMGKDREEDIWRLSRRNLKHNDSPHGHIIWRCYPKSEWVKAGCSWWVSVRQIFLLG